MRALLVALAVAAEHASVPRGVPSRSTAEGDPLAWMGSTSDRSHEEVVLCVTLARRRSRLPALRDGRGRPHDRCGRRPARVYSLARACPA